MEVYGFCLTGQVSSPIKSKFLGTLVAHFRLLFLHTCPKEVAFKGEIK